jgi:hypothetical protein
MLTAGQIIGEAGQRAKVPGYVTQGLQNLNAVLSDLCQHHDFALARGVFNFNFNPSLATMYGSGPYPLPLDYLRTSGTSGATGAQRSAWYLYPTPAFPSGQPMYMTPIDLAEFDGYPQFPSQSLPELWATDMGGPLSQRIVSSQIAILGGGTLIGLSDTSRLSSGMAIAGDAILPGTTISSVAGFSLVTTGDSHTSTLIDNIPSTVGVVVGQPVRGGQIPPYTYVAAIPGGGTSVTLSQAAFGTQVGTDLVFEGGAATLSRAPTIAIAQASVFLGIAPVGYAYPPPLGNYPVTIRYQRQMPPIVDLNTVPWFPDEGYLITATAARLTEISDDARTDQMEARAARRMQKYLELSDDKTNRAQQIQLDQRTYGGGTPYARARNTKIAGW